MMKILRIKLVNFIGIMHGLGKNEIEIDFTKGNNRIVMFLGKNGSGKSTIVGSLTPFKQSTDNREQLILENEDGIKEIDYEHDGHIYKIKHTYPDSGTAQSFISKDGVELNENGGVKTCEDIILKEFGITKDYFKIGKIGSNTKNFVDFTAAERKKYIGNFLDIEEMLDKYKIANDKLRNLKKDVVSVANELKAFEDKSVLETRMEQLEKDIADADAKLEKLLPSKGISEEYVNSNSASSESMRNAIPSMRVQLAVNEKELKKALSEKEDFESKIDPDKATENLEELKEKSNSLQSDIRVANVENASKKALSLEYGNKISGLKIELDAFGNPEDIAALSNKINETKALLSEISERIKANPMSKVIKDMRKDKRDISKYIEKFSNFAEFLEKYYSDLNNKSLNTVDKNIELFMNAEGDESLQRQIKSSRDAISAKQTLLNSQEQERSKAEAHLNQADILEKRPSECTIDGCPFIANALKWKNAGKIVEEKDAEILQLKKDIELMETKAENLNELLMLYKAFITAFSAVGPRDNPIFLEFISDKSLLDWMNCPISEFKSSIEKHIADSRSAQNDFNDYLSLYAEIAANEKSKGALESKDTTLKSKYENDIAEYEKKRELVNADIAAGEEKEKSLSEQLVNVKSKIEEYTKYFEACDKAKSLSESIAFQKKTINDGEKNLLKYEKECQNLESLKYQILSTQSEKAQKTSEYNKVIATISQVQQLTTKLDNLKKVYKPTETVAKALSPTSGIPLVLIKMYLSQTEQIANDLLEVAYNGDFSIHFETTEKEFLIHVIGKDPVTSVEYVKEDISLASQGEIALTTISISLALIEQAIGDYNILCLDEIDGPLDSSNRENFINILNKQMDKLGIEQVFVISHNNAFDVCPLDLVLLKNSDVDRHNSVFMENKNILFNYEDVK